MEESKETKQILLRKDYEKILKEAQEKDKVFMESLKQYDDYDEIIRFLPPMRQMTYAEYCEFNDFLVDPYDEEEGKTTKKTLE